MTDDERLSFARQPALDGVRAIAVIMVLLFHAGWSVVPAGYLGVSVFFTLSGYLITSLLLIEHTSTGRIDRSAFWSRRMRRLLPASCVCLVAVVIASGLGAFSDAADLRRDVVAAALQVYNWVQLAGNGTYTEIFSTPSPLDHYWSLAIEEQFYWVWPLLFVALVAFGRRSALRTRTVLVGLATVSSIGAVAIAQLAGPDAAYWSTFARLPELLVGAALATWLADAPALAKWTRHLAPVALAIIVACVCTWPSASGPAYEGALPLFALVSAALIVGLQHRSSVARALSTRPMVWVGLVSYGVYLYHWPIFVLMRQRGWQLDRPFGTTVALGLTFAAAAASARFVERPIRSARWPIRRTFALAGVATATVVAAAFVLVARVPPVVNLDGEVLAAAAIEPAASVAPLGPASTASVTSNSSAPDAEVAPTSTTLAADPSSSTVEPGSAPVETDGTGSDSVSSPTAPMVTDIELVEPSRPVRILVVGDSTAAALGEGLATWAVEHPAAAAVDLEWVPGATFLTDPELVSFEAPQFVAQSQLMLTQDVPTKVAELHPDVVVLMVTVDDVADRLWSTDEGVLDPFDARFRARMNDAYGELTSALLANGVGDVVWVIPPVPTKQWQETEMRDPARYRLQHDVIREMASGFGPDVGVIDLAGWMAETGTDEQQAWRPDGVHLDSTASAELARRYVGPFIVNQALTE